MRKILLSFQPYWVEKIMNGEKIFEYRRRFANEPVEAFMYVSTPVKAVTGIIRLGEKVPLVNWLDEYADDPEIRARVEDFLTRNNYVMKILDVQPTTSVSLSELKEAFPGFMAPQGYYNLDNNLDLLDYLECKIKKKPGYFINDFTIDISSKVCEKL